MNVGIFLVLLSIVSASICFSIAKKRGVNPTFWVILATVVGPFAVPFVFLAKPQVNASHSSIL